MVEREVESTYVEMKSKCGKQFILGSVYKSSNTNEAKLKEHLLEVCTKVKGEKGDKELVMGMDHNMNLLKCHEHSKTQHFLDLIHEQGLMPTITRPTRITKSTATLIDNIFVSTMLQ